MLDKPLVSIIIPTFNSSGFLEECLKSIRGQMYGNIEIVVVDNFSGDLTLSIAKRYADKVFVKGPERSAQRNFGAENCAGDHVVFVDSDMKLSENVISSCVEKIKQDKSIKGVIIPEESFGVGFWAQCKKLEKSFYVGVDWIEAARFFEKKAFQEVGGYDENMASGEDWNLSQKLGKKHKIGRIKDFIYHNEGRISLIKTIKKKFYYAKKFSSYAEKRENQKNLKKQASIADRYKLFFSKPEKLFLDPVVGIGMLFMKTCEFGFGGIGYLIYKFAI